MFCRLESLDETEYNLRNQVKKCTIFWIIVLKFSKCDLKIDVIENVTQLFVVRYMLLFFFFKLFCNIYIHVRH